MTVGTLDWEIERKNASGGWDVVKSKNGSNTPTWSGAACEEVRIRVTSGSLGIEDNCTSVESKVTVSDPVKFADFRLVSRTRLAAPEAPNTRKTLGPREEVIVEARGSADQFVNNIFWNIEVNGSHTIDTGGFTEIVASDRASNIVVTAVGGSCSREIAFQVKEPNRIELDDAGYIRQSDQFPDGGFCSYVLVRPMDVSFEGLRIIESYSVAVASGSWSHINGVAHCNDTNSDGLCDTNFDIASGNRSVNRDRAQSGAAYPIVFGGSVFYLPNSRIEAQIDMHWNFASNPLSPSPAFGSVVRQVHVLDPQSLVVTTTKSNLSNQVDVDGQVGSCLLGSP